MPLCTGCACWLRQKQRQRRNSGSGAIKKIEALVEDGSSFNDRIDEVKVFMYTSDDKVEVATGTYADGGFVIELPATVENSLLESGYFDMDEMPPGFTISGNKNTMMDYAELKAYKSGVEVGSLYYEYESETKESYAELLYVDSDLSISGSFTQEDGGEKYTISASVAFKKGWNFAYYSEEETAGGEYKDAISTSAPSGLKWHFESNGNNPGGDGIGDNPSIVTANGVVNSDSRITTVRVAANEGLGMTMKSNPKLHR